MAEAIFGAGCFWGVEATFQKITGVTSTEVGYAGGHTDNPTYEEICSSSTGHAEVVALQYDPAVVSYETLLQAFWESHDPTTQDRQGPDIGTQYRSCIFTFGDEQQSLAEKSKAGAAGRSRPSRRGQGRRAGIPARCAAVRRLPVAPGR